jgi:transcription initiation factor TFIIE subunit beta
MLTSFLEGLQAAAAEAGVPKQPGAGKKKGKKGAPKQRQVKLTNTHLKGVDLTRDYVPPSQ